MTPATAYSAELRELVRPETPVASVYLGNDADLTGDQSEDQSIRIRRLLGELEQQGADPATVNAVRARLAAHPANLSPHLLIAAAGQVRFAHDLRGLAQPDEARYAAPARVAPVLAWLVDHPPYVLVVTDRTGADITSIASGHEDRHTETVVGPDDEIERNAPGGWSQPRYQRRAEDSWRHNAAAVADATLRALVRVQARLLLVAGDVRAVQLLGEDIRDHEEVVVRQVPGGRSADGSEPVRRAAVAQAIGDFVGQETEELVVRLGDTVGAGGLGVAGLRDTLAALATGRVRTLLVVDDPGDQRMAWFGPQTLCAPEPLDGGGQSSGRLVDVAIRAALLTDADVRIIPASAPVAEGIGALCRFGM